MTNDKARQIAALEAEIAALKRQWPAHSVPPAMLQRLDELDEALAEVRADQDEKDSQ